MTLTTMKNPSCNALRSGSANLLSAGLVLAMLSGCSAVVRTPYQQPALNMPVQFSQQNPQATGVNIDQIKDQWWTLFQDAELNRLVEQALQRNNDLAVAGIRLKQAREQAGLARNQQLPRVSANSSASHQVELRDGDNSSRGFSLNGSVSYEVDLWGKLASQTDAAKWEASATQQDLQSTAQTLVGTVCTLYWQVAYLNQRISSSEASVNSSKKLYELVKAQYQAGAVSGLEMAQAEQAVVGQQANYSQLLQQRIEALNALSILFDQPPAALSIAEPSRLSTIKLPDIQAGLPADLLARRPDLQAAELRLRKALANTDATKASYYPSLSLSSSIGTSSTSLTELLKNPVMTLGAGLSLPFLQYNDMQRNLAISKLDYESAIISFRQTLYSALADVGNALSANTQLKVQADAQQRTLVLAKKSESLNEIRYRAGAVALKQWIDAQESRRNAENSAIQIRLNQLNNMVTLMQSLGGSPVKS
jgi:NodT family efflux transporter outer membrane factor (OMF) lipoprotein